MKRTKTFGLRKIAAISAAIAVIASSVSVTAFAADTKGSNWDFITEAITVGTGLNVNHNYVVDDPNVDTADLPAKFDLRDVDGACYVPEVRFQNPFGTCWSFGATAAAEVSVAAEVGADFKKLTDDEKAFFDFSEHHLAWFAYEPIHEDDPLYASQAGEGVYRVYSSDYLSEQEQAIERFNTGGMYYRTLPLYASGVGPVSESFVPYMNKAGVYEAFLATYELNTKEEYQSLSKEGTDKKQLKETIIYDDENVPYADYEKKIEAAKKVAKNCGDGWQGAGKYFKAYYMPSDKGDWTVDYSKKYSYAWQIDNASQLPDPATKGANGEYVYNEKATDAIKRELCSGRAVAIAYKAEQSRPGQSAADDSYMSFRTKNGKVTDDPNKAAIWTHYTYDKSYDLNDPESFNKQVVASHAVCIVGYDDDFPKEYFNDPNGTIGGNGAWIVRNSWGSKDNSVDSSRWAWGNNGDGYAYISYYDQSLVCPQSYDFRTSADGSTENADGIYNHMYDHLGESLKEITTDKDIYMANEFTEEGDSVLTDIGLTTSTPNSTINYEIYFLDDKSKNPTDGKKVASGTKTFDYAGFHCVRLDKEIALSEGQKYSIVAKIVREDGKNSLTINFGTNETYCGHVLEEARTKYIEEHGDDLGFKPGDYVSYYSKAVINEGESFIGAKSGKTTEWADWKDVAEQAEANVGNNIDFDNLSIRAYVKGNVIEVKNTVDDPKEYYKEGDVIEGTVSIKNDVSSDSTYTIENIKLEDSLGCISEEDANIGSLKADESKTIKYTYKVTAEDVKAGSITSTVNITVDGQPYSFIKELAKNSFTVLTAAAPDAPTNVNVDKNGKITWKASENADSYKAVMVVNGVKCFGEEVTDTNYTFKYKPSSDYKVYVVAYGKADTATESEVVNADAQNSGSIDADTYALDYEVRNDGAYITWISGTNDVEEVVIPDKTDAGIPIVGIDDLAFYNCTSLKKVVVPDTVKAKNIGDVAFLTRTDIENICLKNGQDQKLATGLAYAANIVKYKGKSDWKENDEQLEGAKNILRGIKTALGYEDSDKISLTEAADIVHAMYLYDEWGLKSNIVRADNAASTDKMSEKSYENFLAWVKAIPEDVTIIASEDSDAAKYAKGKELIGIKFEETAPEVIEPEEHLKGDANSDGVVNVRDAAFIAAKLAQGKGGELPEYADFNDDSVVNVRDAAAIARYLAFRKDFDEYAQTDEYIQRMACQSAGEQAHKAVREEYGEGDWITDYPTILSYTDKNNYEISVKIYIKDKPETAHTYINKNVNGKFSFEKAD